MGLKCEAKKKSGGLCQNPAGHSTDHVGTGRCHFHDRGAKPKNKNAQKHGAYARNFSDAEMQEALAMQGSIDSELAIARLQLFHILQLQKQYQDTPVIQEISERTIVQVEQGVYVENQSQPFERKRIYQRRDFSYEITRLIALIAKLESTSLSLQQKQLEIDELKKRQEPKQGQDDLDHMTDKELDEKIMELFS
ncbi:hypothetical protein F900_03437 [Acinetobacter modestus]|uniref:Uncharacterized protein n=1 Tax=Acinetobacter modestus TaxID=1776740 RepID=N9MXG1_9GAMM|nr:hypothetical protein [Acinetobacter modestus]ENW97970.1 hypothetical protein F900_03437 [Acinetobacter modestus]